MMQTIYLSKGDPRLGLLTHEGQYRWPSQNVAGFPYQIPNVQPHFVSEKPDDLGGRWFVILCVGYFDADVHVGDIVVSVMPSLNDLESVSPDELAGEPVDAPAPKSHSKRRGSK